MPQKFKAISENFGRVFQRYPMVLAFALIATFAMILVSGNSFGTKDLKIYNSLLTAFFGIPLTFAAKMLSQRIGKEIPIQIASLLLLGLLWNLLPEDKESYLKIHALVLIPCFILCNLLVVVLPFIGKSDKNTFWNYNISLFLRFISALVFTGILTVGVLFALLTIDQLFNARLENSIFIRTFCTFSILGSCYAFLLLCGQGLSDLKKKTSYPQYLKFFTQFVLIPLLLVYGAILYFYAAKILFAWRLPKGWVSVLILTYGTLGIFAQLLIYPLTKTQTTAWVKLFNRVFYFSLIPLLILLFIAISTRLYAYGYTEMRYFTLVLAIWLAFITGYHLLSSNPSIKLIPITLLAGGLFAVSFPYLNAFSVTKRSQKEAFQRFLSEERLVKNGKLIPHKTIDYETSSALAEKIVFFRDRSFHEPLLEILPNSQAQKYNQIKNDPYFSSYAFVEEFFMNEESTPSKVYKSIYSTQLAVEIKNYRYFLSPMDINTPITVGSEVFVLDDTAKVILIDGKETIALKPYLEDLYRRRNEDQIAENLFLEILRSNNRKIKVGLSRLSYFEAADGRNVDPDFSISVSYILVE
ncbi:DUF4153 domain-containing protein [Bergeyella sp. RCAD1439]|uniref:DUF4153 domain-containing protein n=1 Tax=Bergeyella anatis TaxID=3113737 RepID=UPI002E18F583|nr:DUF4153 domain-containing protein [Bergeyella sp. RCAD1439]